MLRNKDLDSLSIQNVTSQLQYQFRERHPDKEIQPDMHFTAKTALERIENYLKEHTQTQVEVFLFIYLY